MKKIMILGASYSLIPLIHAAQTTKQPMAMYFPS